MDYVVSVVGEYNEYIIFGYIRSVSYGGCIIVCIVSRSIVSQFDVSSSVSINNWFFFVDSVEVEVFD